jgi:hypothetical protein
MDARRFLIGLALLLASCQPKIGDTCVLHTDCSATGGRICEPNLPGGYCTIFNCEPGTCPAEAACVAYGVDVSTACSTSLDRRLERTFCMKSCTTPSDCDRGGYECIDVSDPLTNPWGAQVVDVGKSGSICTIPASRPPMVTGESTQVCAPPADASFPDAKLPVPDAGVLRVPDSSFPREAGSDAGEAGVPRDAALPDARTRVDASKAEAGIRDAARDGTADGTAP